MKMIIRADDFGISPAVNAGIMSAYQKGLIKNIGLMSNMPYAKEAYEMIQDKRDICLGLHVNLILGYPCTDPYKIPSLVNEQQQFISSKQRRKEIQDGIDAFSYEEVLLEVKAQIERFVAICHRLPDYIDAHAVCTENSEKAIIEAAKSYGITIMGHIPSKIWEVCQKDPTNHDFYSRNLPFVDFFKKYLTYSEKINLVVFHPGFIDFPLLNASSLTLYRAYDAALLCDEEVEKYIKEQQIELLTFKEASEYYEAKIA